MTLKDIREMNDAAFAETLQRDIERDVTLMQLRKRVTRTQRSKYVTLLRALLS